MPKENRALTISISVELIEELLERYVKDVPEDIKVDSADYSPTDRILKFYFTSKEFPVAKSGLRKDIAVGKISVYKDADGTTTVMLKWKDPNKKKED